MSSAGYQGTSLVLETENNLIHLINKICIIYRIGHKNSKSFHDVAKVQEGRDISQYKIYACESDGWGCAGVGVYPVLLGALDVDKVKLGFSNI